MPALWPKRTQSGDFSTFWVGRHPVRIENTDKEHIIFCVNCGVGLDPSAKTCPLCGTPAWHPELDAPPFFPANSAAVQPASRREAAILLTAMLVSVSLCCGLLNLFLPTDRPWSLYVIGAAVMLWVWFTLPMVLRRLPVFFRSPPMRRGHWPMSGSSPSTQAAAAGSGGWPCP